MYISHIRRLFYIEGNFCSALYKSHIRPLFYIETSCSTLYISHIKPLLELGSCVWNLEYISDIKLQENVRSPWTKRIDGFENLTYSLRF